MRWIHGWYIFIFIILFVFIYLSTLGQREGKIACARWLTQNPLPQALIIVLIYETRPSSPWKPYIDLLPRNFNTLMYWTAAELAELQGSAVVAKVGKTEADAVFREKLWPIVKVRLLLLIYFENQCADYMHIYRNTRSCLATRKSHQTWQLMPLAASLTLRTEWAVSS